MSQRSQTIAEYLFCQSMFLFWIHFNNNCYLENDFLYVIEFLVFFFRS